MGVVPVTAPLNHAHTAPSCHAPHCTFISLISRTLTAPQGFEEVKDVVLECELFSVENDLMTPSFKLKRPQLLKRYKQQIDAMYARMKQGAGV